uniref:Oxidoreductase-like domain-containing protein n=1 Tax=Ixodes ricinus TaxID=34613 RepID=A0A0K8RCL4_IXORI
MHAKTLTKILADRCGTMCLRRFSQPPSRRSGESDDSSTDNKKPPTPPGDEDCCKSGCSNCVWLKYAEALVDYYKDGGVKAQEAIAKIPDDMVREFVKMEIAYWLRNK